MYGLAGGILGIALGALQATWTASRDRALGLMVMGGIVGIVFGLALALFLGFLSFMRLGPW